MSNATNLLCFHRSWRPVHSLHVSKNFAVFSFFLDVTLMLEGRLRVYVCVCVEEQLYNACVNTQFNKWNTSLVSQHTASTSKKSFTTWQWLLLQEVSGWMQNALVCYIMLLWTVGCSQTGRVLMRPQCSLRGCGLALLSDPRSGSMPCILIGEPD